MGLFHIELMIIHFGINPVSGGIPLKDRIIILIGMRILAGSLFIDIIDSEFII